jgi:hypothetical protein
MAELTPDEVARIREEERVRAEVRLEVAREHEARAGRSRFVRTLVVWLFLVVVVVGIWRVFAADPNEGRSPPASSP